VTATWTKDGVTTRRCTTVWQYGIYRAYGAWGDYIDGCTAKLQCPLNAHYCHVYNYAWIETQEPTGHRVTLNSRLRWDASFKDVSCADINFCIGWVQGVPVGLPVIGPGVDASTQCNGVRDEDIPDRDQTLARVACEVGFDVR